MVITLDMKVAGPMIAFIMIVKEEVATTKRVIPLARVATGYGRLQPLRIHVIRMCDSLRSGVKRMRT